MRRKSVSSIIEETNESLATRLKNKLPSSLRPTRGNNPNSKNLLNDVLGGRSKYDNIKNFIEEKKQFTAGDYIQLKNMMDEVPQNEKSTFFIGARGYRPFMMRLESIIKKSNETQELKQLRESKSSLEQEKKDVEETKSRLLSELDKFKTKEVDLYYKDLEKRYYDYTIRELLETSEGERKEFPIINKLIKDIERRAIAERNKIQALEAIEMTQPREIDFNVLHDAQPSRYFDRELYKNDRGFSYITEPSFLERKLNNEIYREEARAPKYNIKKSYPSRETLMKLEMDKEKKIKSYRNTAAEPSSKFKPVQPVINQGFQREYEPFNPFNRNSELNQDEIYSLIQ
jgi:hypothetical protein